MDVLNICHYFMQNMGANLILNGDHKSKTQTPEGVCALNSDLNNKINIDVITITL